jgi:hypothetical protein
LDIFKGARQMRIAPYPVPALVIAAVTLAASLGTATAARSDSGAKGPPASMFKSDYNKCKLASLAAISKAGREHYTQAKFDGKTCTWSSADGNYVIVVDTHPAGYIDLMVPSVGAHPNGEFVSRFALPSSSRTVIDDHPYANTHRYQADLFATYALGIVQVSIDNATPLPGGQGFPANLDPALFAVIRLLTRT